MKTLKLKNHEELYKFLVDQKLVDPNNKNNNAQFLAHATKDDNLINTIVNTGLKISNRGEVDSRSDSYVAAGLLSTNELINDENNNIDLNNLYSSYHHINDQGLCPSIISAIPQELEGIFLGKISHDKEERKQSKACVLDALNIDTLPSEFILGVNYINPYTHESTFLVNPHFYSLNESNKKSAINKLNNLINKPENEMMAEFLQGESLDTLNRFKHISSVYQQIYDHFDPIQNINNSKDEILYQIFKKGNELDDKIKKLNDELLEMMNNISKQR